MKFVRLLAIMMLVGPMISIASDACCAPEETHAEAIQADSCGPGAHVEAAADNCCHEDRCAECAACHIQSFSPAVTHASSNLLSTPHRAIQNNRAFSEVVSTVLTPPPSL